MLNTITISDDTDSVSDIDAQSILDTVALPTESLLKSPWKGETDLRSCCSSNEEDSNVLPRTPIVRPNCTKKSMTTGRKVKKNSINKITTSALENSIQRSNRSQWVKLFASSKKKPQKYHWSGTFRTKTSPICKDVRRSSLHSPHDIESDDNDQLTNYNYDRGNCGEKKATNNKENIFFYSNEFDRRKNEQINNISYRRYNCVDKFNDHFKDYDIEQDNDSLSSVFSDFNINLRPRMTIDVDDKDKDAYNANLNQQEDISTLYSHSDYSTNNINKEECNNLRSAKGFLDSSINNELIDRKVINDTERNSTVRSRCHKWWCLLLSFIKNVVLFSLLPVTYIIFFIYVQEIENK